MERVMLSPYVPDLRALEVLAAVDEAGSLRGAAGVVGVTQQAVSLRVRAIERQVGVPLLVRGPHGSTLTPAGRLLAQWGSRVLSAASELDAGVTTLRTDRQAQLHLAASLTVAEHLMPGWLLALRHQQEAIGDRPSEVRLEATNSERVGRLVATGRVGLGFVEGPRAPAGLRSRVVAHDRLVVVVPPGHPWARRRRPVGPAELAETALVVRETGSGTRRAFDLALAAALANTLAATRTAARWSQPSETEIATPALELSSATAVRASIVAGVAPGVLSSLAVQDDLEVGRLVEASVELDLRRSLRAVWLAGSAPPAGPARALVAVAAARVTPRDS
jgi:DNA-binding transcriptional LysR family regulator